MTVEGIEIEVQYKNVRGIRLVVYPDMRVRVSAPYLSDEDEVRQFVESRMPWLRRTLAKMEERKRRQKDHESPTLTPLQQLVEHQKRYQRLMAYLKPRFEYWRERMELPPARFSIRSMQTRWGSCTPARRTIRFNLALADQPERNIDYIIVHELAHLRHANHGPQFKALLTRYIPDWQARRKELKDNE